MTHAPWGTSPDRPSPRLRWTASKYTRTWRVLTPIFVVAAAIGGFALPAASSAATVMADNEIAWQATYWNNVDQAGTPVLQRAQRGFFADTGTPAPGVNETEYSARFATSITRATSTTASFELTCDDGCNLTVNGTKRIQAWKDQGATTYRWQGPLAAGANPITIDYYQGQWGEHVLKLKVTVESSSGTATPMILQGDTTTWNTRYWNTTNQTGTPALQRSQTGFFADTGSPAPGINEFNYSARFTNTLTTTTPGTLGSIATCDDGCRVTINGVNVINAWRDQGATSYTANTPLPTGTHTITIDYYQGQWGEHVLNYSALFTPTTPTTPTTTTKPPVTTTKPPVTTTVPPVTTVPPTGSDLYNFPFNASSPFNQKLSANARFGGAFPQPGGMVQAAAYSIPVYRASYSDPQVRITDDNGRVETWYIPRGAQPAVGSDNNLTVVQPDGYTVREAWNFNQVGTINGQSALQVGYQAKNDLRTDGLERDGNDGVRAAGWSSMLGLIRTADMNQGEIRHALAIAISSPYLRSGPVWPATREDGFANCSCDLRYTGGTAMGTQFALPTNADLSGLSPDGLIIARALQQYGGFISDQAGNAKLYAEPALAGRLDNDTVRRDMEKIFPQMRVVTQR